MSWSGQIPCHPVEVAGLVYVEVPKAGCTSIKWALSRFKGGPPAATEDIHGWFGYTHAQHRSQLNGWLETRWADLFRFTVLRDPIARFLSFYYGLQIHERGCYGDVSRYVESGAFEADPWANDIHAIPQTFLLGGDLSRYDFVGRTEDMGKVEVELRRVTGVHLEIPHANRSTTERRPLSLVAERRLREIYAKDYEVLT